MKVTRKTNAKSRAAKKAAIKVGKKKAPKKAVKSAPKKIAARKTKPAFRKIALKKPVAKAGPKKAQKIAIKKIKPARAAVKKSRHVKKAKQVRKAEPNAARFKAEKKPQKAIKAKPPARKAAKARVKPKGKAHAKGVGRKVDGKSRAAMKKMHPKLMLVPKKQEQAFQFPKETTILFSWRDWAKKPYASIIIPTLNEGKYIEETLESIKGQKGAPLYEIIIVDGGSTDETLEIAKKYADVIVYEPIRNVGVARNSGMFIARGEVLVCANADTYYAENWLERLTGPFRHRQIAGVIGKVLPKDGDLIDDAFAHLILHPAAFVLSKARMHYVDSSSMAIRTNEFVKIGGFDHRQVSGEDTDLLKRIKKHGKVIYAYDSVAYVSMRRVKKWGKIYYTYFHTTNFIKTHLLGESHGNYEPIR